MMSQYPARLGWMAWLRLVGGWPMRSGFAAFSPAKEWGYEELMAYLPPSGLSWLNKDSDEARRELAARVAEALG
jgi:hypothetical protein